MTAGISPETLAAAVSAADLRQIAAHIGREKWHFDESKKLEAMADRLDRLTGEATKRVTNTVADIPDSELVRRAVLNAGHVRGVRVERAIAVLWAFGLGSTYAEQLCRRFALDPHETVGYTSEPVEDHDED